MSDVPPILRDCKECGSVFERRRMIRCTLCHKGFCAKCYIEHVFVCPKNPNQKARVR